MKIVLYANSHIEYTLQLAESLAKLEDLMLMISKNQVKEFSKAIDKSLFLYSYDRYRFRYPTNLIRIFKIIKKIINFNPDVIHLQGEDPWFDLTLPFLSKKYPIIITVHDVILHSGDKLSRKFPSFMYKLNRKFGEQFIVHGKKLKKEMIKEYHKSPDDIHVLPRGINSIYLKYKEHSFEEEKNSVLFFGRIWGYKGLHYLIKAEPLITKKVPDVKIIIAGTGDDFDKYREIMIHKEKFTVYNNHIPNERVPELFQKSSIVVLPYTDASQSGVVPLAYAFKKPVVVTNVGSLPEVVVHDKTGYIVPPRDSKRLAYAIIDLLKNTKKRKKMGENAYTKANEDLSWNSIAEKTIRIYKKSIINQKIKIGNSSPL